MGEPSGTGPGDRGGKSRADAAVVVELRPTPELRAPVVHEDEGAEQVQGGSLSPTRPEPGDSGDPGAGTGPRIRVDPRIRARRIEVRRRAGRRRLRRMVVALAMLSVAALALAASRSPLLDVDHIEVRGTVFSDPASVVAASGIDRGDRLAGVPLGEAADRVARLPWVASASVRRGWPGTVVINVVERSPVAAAPAAGGGFVLLDADGWQAATVGEAPWWLARLEVTPIEVELGERVGSPLRPLLAVAGSVPGTAGSVPGLLGDRLLAIRPHGGEGPVAVEAREVEVDAVVRLPSGATATVRFGGPDQLPRKWLALLTVLDGANLSGVSVIDVRVPNAPALSRS